MSTQQPGEDEIERRLRSLSAALDPIAPRDIYAYIRTLPADHPIRGRGWANPMQLVRRRSASVAAVCASLALAAVIVLSLILRSAGPSSPPAAPGSATATASAVATASASASAGPSSTPVATTPATPGGPFTPTGAMPEYRLAYTATRLLDGRVLIAGGFADGPDLTTAEIYDPASSNFSPTGSMTLGREYPTATLLKDGRVLIVGGDGDPIDTAELFDPATGKFTPTGSPAVGRRFHSATLLKDGRVLIVGGGETNTAELYNPATGKFSRTGSMAGIRYFHTATLLNDGRVLVVGGRTRGKSSDGAPENDVASAEVYDPVTGKFSSTGSMSTPREGHTATLLPDGRVFVAGGSNMTDPNAGTPSSAELYDPATGKFNATGSMITGRQNHTATVLTSGLVFIAGGLTSDSRQSISSVELYDPATGTFRAGGQLLKKAGAVTATLLVNGRVLLLGSDAWASGPPSSELYNP